MTRRSELLRALLAAMTVLLHLLGVSAHCPEGEAMRRYDVTNERAPSVFDGLTANEISDVIHYLKDQGLGTRAVSGNGSVIFSVDRLPPRKADTLAYLDGGGAAPQRYASVILYRGDLDPPCVEELEVGPLSAVNSHVRITSPAWKANISYSMRSVRYDGIEDYIAREMIKVKDILQDVTGYTYTTDCQENCLTFIPGGFGETNRRYWFYLFRQVEGHYLHPVGFQFRVNGEAMSTSDWSVDFIWFKGHTFTGLDHLKSSWNIAETKAALKLTPPLRYDPDDVNLYSSLNHRGYFEPRPASERRGPVTYIPDGRRYMLDGHHVTWQGWQFDFSMQTVKGLRLNDVRFQGVRVVYELGLGEIGVIYSGASPATSRASFLDSEYLIGLLSQQLFAGVDCPDYASYMDFAHYFGGKPFVVEKSACLFEWHTGIPLRRHAEFVPGGGFQYGQAMADNVLVLRSIVTVYNYEYVMDYKFHQNGALEVLVSLSGYILSSYHTGAPGTDRYGFKVAPQTAGQIHNHLVNFKVDLDIIDDKNRFETLDIKIQQDNDTTEPGHVLNTHVFQRHLRESEQQAAYRFNFDTPKYLVFHHNSHSNGFGNQRGYRLVSSSFTKQLLPLNWRTEKAFSWARYQVAVTRHKDEEDQPSLPVNGANMVDPPLLFQDYLNDDQDIVDQDLVAWVTLGTFHIPHSEDIPIVQTPGVQLSFLLQPYNMFNEDPSQASRDNVRVTPRAGGYTLSHAGRSPPSSCPSHKPQTPKAASAAGSSLVGHAIPLCLFWSLF